MDANKVLRVQYAVFILYSPTVHCQLNSAPVEQHDRSKANKCVCARQITQENPRTITGRSGHMSAVTYLTSSVYDLSGIVLVPVLDHAAEGILNRGVIAFHKVPLDELDSEG